MMRIGTRLGRPARSGASVQVTLFGAGTLAILLAAAAPTRAMALQSAAAESADTVHLTLEQAISEALTNNPTYRRAENDLRLNPVESRRTLFDQLLPQTRLSLFNTNFSGNLQRIATDNFGDPISRPDARWTYFSGTTQSLSVGWQTQGLDVFHRHRGQQLTNRGRDLSLRRADLNLKVAVERFYLEVLRQVAVVEAETALVEARANDLEAAQELYALALRSRVDVLQAELAVEQQRATLHRAQGDYDQAVLALASYIGADPSNTFVLPDAPTPAFDPSAFDADELVARALDGNPSMREARHSLAQARLGLDRTKTRWWPNLSLSANVYRRSQGTERTSLFDFSFDEDLDYSFYVGLSFPFLDNFFGDQVNDESASVSYVNQAEAERETRLEIERTVRSALLALENQWQTLTLEEEAHRIAVEALELAREEYRLGARSFTDLRAGIEAEATARRSVITAGFSFHEALISLEEAVAGPIRAETPSGN